MLSFTISDQRCPHCAHRRTVRIGGSQLPFCFNCRQRCDPAARPRPTETADTLPFTPAELARLRIYRRAVQAGFYRDTLPAATNVRCADTDQLRSGRSRSTAAV